MENCITCNCIDEVLASERTKNNLIKRITNFLETFTIEGAEHMSKTK